MLNVRLHHFLNTSIKLANKVERFKEGPLESYFLTLLVSTVGKHQNLTEAIFLCASLYYMLRVQNYSCQFDLLFSDSPEQKDVGLLFFLCCGWHGARVFAVPPMMTNILASIFVLMPYIAIFTKCRFQKPFKTSAVA
jgi:hypothetical protein